MEPPNSMASGFDAVVVTGARARRSRGARFSGDIIALAVGWYVRYRLS